MPLAEVDVARLWWLIDVLVKAEVLARQELAGEGQVSRGRRARPSRPF
jgi:hypothetical protein